MEIKLFNSKTEEWNTKISTYYIEIIDYKLVAGRRRGYAVRYTGEEVFYSKHKGSHLGLRNPELDDGDVLDCNQYPVVWQQGEYIY